MFTSSKLFQHLSSAYRNHNSPKDCFLLHGYCRDVYVEFGAQEMDSQGFVVDYGGLKEIKRWLDEHFDHTTVLQADDPLVPTFKQLNDDGHLKLTLLPMVSCEGWAMYISKYIQQEINRTSNGRAWVNYVEVRENSKNASRWTENTVIVNTDGSVTPSPTDTIQFDDLTELVLDMSGLERKDIL